jgi:putative sterol carrier protein
MTTFASSDEVYEVFVGFMREIAQDPVIGPKFVASKTSFRVHYTDPEAWILVDCKQDPLDIVSHAADRSADVDLTMRADDGHQFWLGNLRIATALARKKIKVTGQLPKMMSLLPAMQPAFKTYRQHLTDTGHADKVG